MVNEILALLYSIDWHDFFSKGRLLPGSRMGSEASVARTGEP